MFKEFRDFINRGNVVDLAVAVIIGVAFGQITTSLVNQVIMPPLGLLVSGVDFANLGVILKDADQYATVADAVLNTLINFFIVAFVIFFVVRAYGQMVKRFEKKEAVAAADPAVPPADVLLLTEIRDLLKQRVG